MYAAEKTDEWKFPFRWTDRVANLEDTIDALAAALRAEHAVRLMLENTLLIERGSGLDGMVISAGAALEPVKAWLEPPAT